MGATWASSSTLASRVVTRRSHRLLVAALCTVPVALGAAPAAHADSFQDVFKSYSKNGTIDPCAFSASQLKQAKTKIPNDIAQYAPDFRDALDAAAKARAGGACAKKSSSGGSSSAAPAAPSGGGSATPPAATPTPAPAPAPASPTATPQPLASVTPAAAVADNAIPGAAASNKDNGGSAPAPLVALAILLVLAALAGAIVAAGRYWAIDTPWMQRSRHATAEAGWRSSAAWAEFTDWLRLGR